MNASTQDIHRAARHRHAEAGRLIALAHDMLDHESDATARALLTQALLVLGTAVDDRAASHPAASAPESAC